MPSTLDVVIVTKDRPQPLSRLLEDLRRLSHRPGRIVIVDDSVRPESWAQRFPDLPVDLVRPERRAFISGAKNLGWERCKSDFVAFVDDDNRVPPDLFSRLTDDLARNPRWGAVMPGVLYHRRPELVWVYATPFRPDRWGFRLIGRNSPRDSGLENRILPTDALPNLSLIRAEVLRAVAGFDEHLPVNSSADLCQRIKQAGWEVFADTGALTQHDVEPPGVPGYWAEHTVQDPERCQLEVADWYRFQRRWNGSGRFFRVRSHYHASGFMIAKLLAACVHRGGRPLRLSIAMIRGVRDGLRDARGEPSVKPS